MELAENAAQREAEARKKSEAAVRGAVGHSDRSCIAGIDHLDPAARRAGWRPVPSGDGPDAEGNWTFVSFATTWADIVTPIRLFRYDLGRFGAVAHKLTKSRGRLRYEALKVSLKVADVALQCANQLIGKDLVFSLRLFDGLKGRYHVRLYPNAGEDVVTAFENPDPPKAAESPKPTTHAGADQ